MEANRYNISITGSLGSGKSTVAKILCGRLGYEYFSTGKIQRQIASERGMTTLELNEACKSDKSVDDYIDGLLRKIDKDPDARYVLDSRMAWFFVKGSFKVYIKVDPGVAATRVLGDSTRKSEPTSDQLSTMNSLMERQRLENERFELIYGADCLDMSNFDLVIDSSERTPSQVADLILEAYRSALQI